MKSKQNRNDGLRAPSHLHGINSGKKFLFDKLQGYKMKPGFSLEMSYVRKYNFHFKGIIMLVGERDCDKKLEKSYKKCVVLFFLSGLTWDSKSKHSCISKY